MASRDQKRIQALQKKISIARTALEAIKYGRSKPESIAEEALERMDQHDPKRPLQGIVGHEPRRRT